MRNSTFSEYNMLNMPKFLYATFSVLFFETSTGFQHFDIAFPKIFTASCQKQMTVQTELQDT